MQQRHRDIEAGSQGYFDDERARLTALIPALNPIEIDYSLAEFYHREPELAVTLAALSVGVKK